MPHRLARSRSATDTPPPCTCTGRATTRDRPRRAVRALVDDPASRPEEFPTVEEQDAERARLHALMEELVVWENSNDEPLLRRAREEIRQEQRW